MSHYYAQYDAIATRIEKALQRLEPKQMFRVWRASEMEGKNLNQYTFLIELKIKINDELYVIYENTGSMFWYDTDDHFREKVRSMYDTMVSQLLRDVLMPKKERERI